MTAKIFLSCLLATALLCLPGCGSAEKQALTDQVADLTAQLETYQCSTLSSWQLTAAARDPEEPVTVHFTAVPDAYRPGWEATLEVTLNNRREAAVSCPWDGSAYTADLALDSADGYGYYCTISSPAGTEYRTLLSSADMPLEPTLTYLAASLDRYCKLVVDDWFVQEQRLALVCSTGMIQLPQITQDGIPAECTDVLLVLEKNGTPVQTRSIAPEPGETAGSLYVVPTGIVFDLPELEPEDQLELYMQAALSTGEVLTSPSVSWYPQDDTLHLTVG